MVVLLATPLPMQIATSKPSITKHQAVKPNNASDVSLQVCTCRFVPLECVDSIWLICFAHPMCWLLVLCFRHAALCLFATQLASVLDPFHKTEKTITGILQAPIKWQIYIHPARLTCQLLPGSGGDRCGPIRADVVGGQGKIQRGSLRRGHKDHERADLYDRCHNYDESLRYLH